jgi:RNA methyltransferase, TrmH family
VAVISSTTNPRVKRVCGLQSSRGERAASQRFVLEGVTLVREGLIAGARFDEVFHTQSFADTPEQAGLLANLARSGASALSVTDAVMRRMADTQTPQGILAVAPFVQLATPESPNFVLIVDSVRDPGNLGTILRLSAGAALPLVLLTPGTVDLYNPKVVRSAMGAHFAVPVETAAWDAIAGRLPSQRIFLADSQGGIPHFDANWLEPCALVVSDEAHGPGDEARRMAGQRVTIPMPGKTESFNVAMATGILIYEMIRQRTEAEKRSGV